VELNKWRCGWRQVWSTDPAAGWHHADEERTPVIPRGPEGAFDFGMVMGTSREPVTVEDEHRWWYTGCTVTHGGPHSEKRMSIGLARWRLHRFFSLDAEPGHEAVVETVPLRLPAGRLEVNADIAADGHVMVEVLELDGSVRTGLTAAACAPLRGDSLRHVVDWSSDGLRKSQMPQELLVRGEVQLRFVMRGARLFSFRVAAPERL